MQRPPQLLWWQRWVPPERPLSLPVSTPPSSPPPKTTIPPLPQELLSEICDWAALICPSSLKNLALTSSAFLDRSQSHLFHSLRVGDQEGLERLQAIFNNNSALFRHTRELDISVTFTSLYPALHSLSSILDELTEIRRLRLRATKVIFAWGHTATQGWKNLIGKALSLPLLTRLSLHNIVDLPIHVLYSARNLRQLEFSGYTSFAEWAEESRVPEGLGWNIRTLQWQESREGIVDPLTHSVYWSLLYGRLVHLHLKISTPSRHKSFWSMVRDGRLSPALQSLRLEYDNPEAIISETSGDLRQCNLPTLPSLRLLSLTINAGYIDMRVDPYTNSDPSPLSTIPLLLQSLLASNPQPSLEAVEIGVRWLFPGYTGYGSPEGASDKPKLLEPTHGWASLDADLANLERTPNLRAVRVFYTCEIFHGHSPGADDAPMNPWRKVEREIHSQVLCVFARTRDRVPVFQARCVGDSETSDSRAFHAIAEPLEPYPVMDGR